MANITNSLLATITATEDSTGNVILNRNTGNPGMDSSVAQGMEYLTLAGATNVTLPIAQTMQVYIRNIDPTKSITVNWTPQGGAAANTCVLYPGDQIILWQKPGGTSAGISALTLTPSAAGALVEYFLGG